MCAKTNRDFGPTTHGCRVITSAHANDLGGGCLTANKRYPDVVKYADVSDHDDSTRACRVTSKDEGQRVSAMGFACHTEHAFLWPVAGLADPHLGLVISQPGSEVSRKAEQSSRRLVGTTHIRQPAMEWQKG